MHDLTPLPPSLPSAARIGGPQVLTYRDVVYAAAEAQGKPREKVRILPLPVALLRLAAVVARLLALVWQPAAAVAGALRFVIYSTTHDSGGPAMQLREIVHWSRGGLCRALLWVFELQMWRLLWPMHALPPLPS